MKKRFLAILLAAAMLFGLVGCSEVLDELDDWEEPEKETRPAVHHHTEHEPIVPDTDETWAVYWYLCGTDLESDGGAATADLEEMMAVALPDNVRVVIETGGTCYWENEIVDPDYLERYLYAGEELTLLEQNEIANMGDPETLADFLCFCQANYPADHTMVLFWDHGGGSVYGAVSDENFDGDTLTLTEFYQAFSSACDLSIDNPPFDVVGFDACLMATVDTAYTFSDIARYMVASEEWEPGEGWSYEGWLQALGENPAMDGAQLGEAICDSYMEGCEYSGMEDEATLSVVDLSRIVPLLQAYDDMGTQALSCALDDPYFFADFGRSAEASENYGGNTWDQGYTNLVDLGHLAENSMDLLPRQAQAVLDGLEECVVYKVNGDYHENASGLSCYYSYDGDEEELEAYKEEGCSDSFKYLYDFELGGELPQEGMDYIGSMGYDELPEVPQLEEDWEEYPLYVDEDGCAVMELDQDTVNFLRSVYFELFYVDEESDIALLLGQDNNLEADWDNGIFRDNFWDTWGAIDDCLVYMEVSYETEDYTVYSVPVLLNGEEYHLRVVYDYEDGEYYITGARQGLDDNGMADRNPVQLKPGDEITTIHYAATMSGDDDFEPVEMETFTVTEDTAFEEVEMGDGVFLMFFELEDARNQTAFSQTVQFTVEDGEIWTEILE